MKHARFCSLSFFKKTPMTQTLVVRNFDVAGKRRAVTGPVQKSPRLRKCCRMEKCGSGTLQHQLFGTHDLIVGYWCPLTHSSGKNPKYLLCFSSNEKHKLCFLLVLQVMTFSWLRSMNWATLWVWSTPVTPRPSWLPSTSGWKQKTLTFLMTTAEAYSNFMVSYQVTRHLRFPKHCVFMPLQGTDQAPSPLLLHQTMVLSPHTPLTSPILAPTSATATSTPSQSSGEKCLCSR